MNAIAPAPGRISPKAIDRARAAVAAVDRDLAERDEWRASLADAIDLAQSLLASLREAGWRDDRILIGLHALEFRQAATAVLRAARRLDGGAP